MGEGRFSVAGEANRRERLRFEFPGGPIAGSAHELENPLIPGPQGLGLLALREMEAGQIEIRLTEGRYFSPGATS